MITKQYASAFFGTTLSSTLTAMGVDTLLIAGIGFADGCIRATALDASSTASFRGWCATRSATGTRRP